MKTKSKKTLLILTSLYALFYLAGMITSIYKGDLSLMLNFSDQDMDFCRYHNPASGHHLY